MIHCSALSISCSVHFLIHFYVPYCRRPRTHTADDVAAETELLCKEQLEPSNEDDGVRSGAVQNVTVEQMTLLVDVMAKKLNYEKHCVTDVFQLAIGSIHNNIDCMHCITYKANAMIHSIGDYFDVPTRNAFAKQYAVYMRLYQTIHRSLVDKIAPHMMHIQMHVYGSQQHSITAHHENAAWKHAHHIIYELQLI